MDSGMTIEETAKRMDVPIELSMNALNKLLYYLTIIILFFNTNKFQNIFFTELFFYYN
ncbi:hypothetical protein [Brachyspira intermedia]|uniref:hypothetical protein n=1 Tax=Brachyspira intermedia TaxID=84377 RepID=UPI003004AFA2